MTFIPKEGMICVTRDGNKVGPLVPDNDGDADIIACGGEKWWRYTGLKVRGSTRPRDLVAEWTDEPALPVRTRTVTEIVPGTYGKVVVKDSEVAFVILSFLSQYGEQSPWSFTWTADETRAAARVLNQIADAMGEKP